MEDDDSYEPSDSEGSFNEDESEWDEEDGGDDDEEVEESSGAKVAPERSKPTEPTRGKRKRKADVKYTLPERDKKRAKNTPPVPFEARFKELQVFRARFGHCNVPKDWPESPGLAGFVKRMRYDYKIGDMAEDRVKRLNEIGFTWVMRPTGTNDFLARLKAFKESTGHLNMPNNRIAAWCSKVRQKNYRGELDKETFDALDALGFDWTPARNKVWEQNIAKLKAFKEKHGHTRVSKEDDSNLFAWCAKARSRYHYLPEVKRNVLIEMDFEFSHIPDTKKKPKTWFTYYDLLKDFKNKNGHVNVAASKNEKLNRWIYRMRSQESQDLLAPEKKEKLTALGVKWTPRLPKPVHMNEKPEVPDAVPEVPPQDWETIEIKEM